MKTVAFIVAMLTSGVTHADIPETKSNTNAYISTLVASYIQAPSEDVLSQEVLVQLKVQIGKHGKISLVSISAPNEDIKNYVLNNLSGIRIPNAKAFQGQVLDVGLILKGTQS